MSKTYSYPITIADGVRRLCPNCGPAIIFIMIADGKMLTCCTQCQRVLVTHN